jgi:hypothetical protein
MVGRSPIVFLFAASLFASGTSPALLAADDHVRFDVPGVVPARESTCEAAVLTPLEKLVEVVIPVSTQIDSEFRNSIDEFRFDIFWNRAAFAVSDYGPRTQTVSDIEGLITVDKRNDKNASLGLNLKGDYQGTLTATTQAQLTNSRGTTYHYTEIPQYEVLVASGTIKRGTGAFFRFHPSKRGTLEGGRDLVVAYRVPTSWRGGILQVECRAEGEKKLIGPWGDSIKVGKSFVMPVYLEGDDQARVIATEFAQAQENLTARWNRQLHEKSSGGFKRDIEALFGVESAGGIPPQWTQQLIQSGDDRHFERYEQQLPDSVRNAAAEFVEARRQLAGLAR